MMNARTAATRLPSGSSTVRRSDNTISFCGDPVAEKGSLCVTVNLHSDAISGPHSSVFDALTKNWLSNV